MGMMMVMMMEMMESMMMRRDTTWSWRLISRDFLLVIAEEANKERPGEIPPLQRVGWLVGFAPKTSDRLDHPRLSHT
jgi:hypothetical protein